MNLSSHLKTLSLRRDLADIESKTHNVGMILARTDPNDTAAQANLAIMIHLHEIYAAALKAKIELVEEWEGFPDKPDKGGRRKTLEQALRDWDDAMPLWRQKYKETTERCDSWEQERQSKKTEPAERAADPAQSEPELIPWRGTERELASYLIEQHEKGEIGEPGQSNRQVVIQNAGRYVIIDKNGGQKRVNPESLWRNYYQQTQ